MKVKVVYNDKVLEFDAVAYVSLCAEVVDLDERLSEANKKCEDMRTQWDRAVFDMTADAIGDVEAPPEETANDQCCL